MDRHIFVIPVDAMASSALENDILETDLTHFLLCPFLGFPHARRSREPWPEDVRHIPDDVHDLRPLKPFVANFRNDPPVNHFLCRQPGREDQKENGNDG